MLKVEYVLSVLIPEYEKAILMPFNNRHDCLVAWSQIKDAVSSAIGTMYTSSYEVDGVSNSMISRKSEELK